jgi:hypothetical protein
MSEELKFKGELEAQEVIDGLDEIDQSIKKTKESAEGLDGELKKTRNTNKKKDWKGLVDIFQSVLPRGLQRSIRGFMGTSRSVKRASTSFKILGTSIAALGIPLLIQGLTWLIANWDKVSDFFTGTSEAMKFQAKLTDEATNTLVEFNLRNQQYIEIVNDSTRSIEERTQAQKELAKSSQEVADLDITQADDLNTLNEAVQRASDLEVLRTDRQQIALRIADKRKEVRNAELSWWDYITISMRGASSAYGAVSDKMNEAAQEADALQLQLNGVIEQQNRINAEIEENLRLKREEAEAARQKEKDDAAAAKRLQYRIKLQDELNDKEELYGLEGLMRETKLMEQQFLRQKKQAAASGASKTQLEQMEEQFYIDLALLQDKYYNESEEKRKEDEDRKKEAADLAYLAAQDAEDRLDKFLEYSRLEGEDLRFEKEKDAIVQAYEERFALAVDNAELTKELDAQMRLDIEQAQKEHDQVLVDQQLKTDKARLTAQREFIDTSLNALGSLIRAGENNEATQRAFAVTEILINQGRAFSSALAGATAAAAATGPAAPFTLAGYIASMVGALTSGFAQIKSIMSQADADVPDPSVDNLGRLNTVQQTLVPEGNENQNFTGGNMIGAGQAYVVQSQLEGQQMLQARINAQTTL